MKFFVRHNIITKKGRPMTWIPAGEYPIVRIFDKDRFLIDIGMFDESILTLVRQDRGIVVRN